MAYYKTSNTIIPHSLPPPLFTLLFLTFLCLIGFYFLHQPTTTTTAAAASLRHQHLFVSSATNTTLSAYLRALTLHPHLAGTHSSLSTLHYLRTHFSSDLSLPTHTSSFDALLSYPTHSSLSLHFPNNSSSSSSDAALHLSLVEPGQSGRVVQPYHAYSPSASLAAPPVFVNYGAPDDYRALQALGVDVSGCVVVARRGKGSPLARSAVVEAAAEEGAAAVLMYADGEDERFNEGVERGTVMNGLGDPLTPGWGAAEEEEAGEKMSAEDGEVAARFPRIPSMPISAANAEVILRSLEGPRWPPEWRDTVKFKVGAWRVGPGPALVNFTYQVRMLVRG